MLQSKWSRKGGQRWFGAETGPNLIFSQLHVWYGGKEHHPYHLGASASSNGFPVKGGGRDQMSLYLLGAQCVWVLAPGGHCLVSLQILKELKQGLYRTRYL